MISAYKVGTAVSNVLNHSMTYVSDAFNSSVKSDLKSDAYTKDAVIPTEPPNKVQAIYPENPFDFNPNGLIRTIRVDIGNGKTGGIIQWIIPGVENKDIVIFEWDEDYKKGAHYHAMLPIDKNIHQGDHNCPGDPVAEPWNTEYFNY